MEKQLIQKHRDSKFLDTKLEKALFVKWNKRHQETMLE